MSPCILSPDNGNISKEASTSTGGQSQDIIAQEPKRKKAKSRPADASEGSVEEESESKLHKQWLKSAIEKNKVQTEVAQLKKQKLLLEINALTRQQLDCIEIATSSKME